MYGTRLEKRNHSPLGTRTALELLQIRSLSILFVCYPQNIHPSKVQMSFFCGLDVKTRLLSRANNNICCTLLHHPPGPGKVAVAIRRTVSALRFNCFHALFLIARTNEGAHGVLIPMPFRTTMFAGVGTSFGQPRRSSTLDGSVCKSGMKHEE